MSNYLQSIEDASKKSCDIYNYLGLKVEAVEDNYFKASIPLHKPSVNHVGIMHAAVLFAVGEFLGGLVCTRHIEDKEKFQPVVRDLKIDFSKPALTDVYAEAEFPAEQVAALKQGLNEDGRFDFEMVASVKDANGVEVAQTTANYAIRNFMGK